ncbi:MAG: type III pantothenate kinase [Alistipes sp.]|nr:type III pantothenate kinase [Alistipes sp.]
MNLVVDIGNSLIKTAVMDGGEAVDVRRYELFEGKDAMALAAEYPSLERAIVASTGQDTARVAAILREAGLRVLQMSHSTAVPIGNGYRTPQTLGVDRLAAAVGAVCVMGCRDCVIVDFGTAITIDLVEGGVFRGGNISPGVRTRFRALHDYTERLPECEPTEEQLAIGGTTREAIEQGVMQGITHEIEGYIRDFMQSNAKLSLIFTGGDAKYFVKRIKNAIFAKCDLVFCGLNTILEYNASIKEDIF